MSDSEKQGNESIPYPDRKGAWKKAHDESASRTGRQKVWRFLGYATAVFFCVVALSAGTVIGLFSRNEMMRGVLGNMVKNPIETITKRDPFAAYKPETYLPGQHIVNVLFLGCDYDYNEKAQSVKSNRGRSDAILIARVDFDTGTINLLSVPRDTAVNIPGHLGIHKINAAHSFGGPELTIETIQGVFGIKADYYATVHFDSFQKIVNEIGGVDINVARQLDYDDNWGNLHVHLKPGFQHLDGYKAMGYVRIRHSDSDLMRAQRQQEFMQALRTQISSPSNFLKLPNVLSAITDSITTNMTQDQMLTLAAFAKKIPRENIQLATIPVVEGPSFVYLKTEATEKLIRKLFYNDDPLASVAVNGIERVTIATATERNPVRHERRRHRGSRRSGAVRSAAEDEGSLPSASSTDKPSESGSQENREEKDSSSPSEPKTDPMPMPPSDPPNGNGTVTSPG